MIHTLQRNRDLRLAALCIALAPACSSEQPSATNDADGNSTVAINYRGTPMLATRHGDDLIIQGDILVMQGDLGPVEEVGSPGETEPRRGALSRIPGRNRKWTDGNVNFSLANIAEADRVATRAGVDMWRKAVPGLTLTELVAPCPMASNCIEFRAGTINISGNGRETDPTLHNVILLVPGASPATTVHELAHALGAFHEQSRSDRDSMVQIHWNQIRGCRNDATSSSQCGATACAIGTGTAREKAIANGCCTGAQFDGTVCFEAHNFEKASPQGLLFSYDYGSIMHYHADAFSKTGAVTITPLMSLPPGVNMGLMPGPSSTDIASMNALYPVATVRTVLFRKTGTQTVSELKGRSQDINTKTSCTVAGVSITAPTIDTALLVEGASTISCTVKNPLWEGTYAYPNTTVTVAHGPTVETFTTSANLRVLNAGLIPVFTAVL